MIIGLLRLLLVGLIVWAIMRLVRGWLANTEKKTGVEAAQHKADTLLHCPVCNEYRPSGFGACSRSDCPRSKSGTGNKLAALWLAGLVLAASLSPAFAAQDGGRYMIELAGSNVKATLYVNDIPAEVWTFGSAPDEAGASFNHWLQGGRNTLRLSVDKDGTAGASTFQARVYYMGLSQQATGAEGTPTMVDLMRLDRMPPKGQAQEVGFTVARSPALVLWAAGDTADLTADTPALLAALATCRDDVVQTLNAGSDDVTTLPSLAAERADMAMAYGAQPDASKSGLALQPAKADTQSEDKVAVAFSSQEEDLDMTLLPNRPDLVRVARKDGKPLIYAQKDGKHIEIAALVLAKRQSAWHILRRTH